MSLYVYMSEQRGVYAGLGRVTGLRANNTVFRLRGEHTNPKDDPHSFKRMMARRGHRVVISAEKVGKPESEVSDVLIATASDLKLPVDEAGFIAAVV